MFGLHVSCSVKEVGRTENRMVTLGNGMEGETSQKGEGRGRETPKECVTFECVCMWVFVGEVRRQGGKLKAGEKESK